MSNESRVDSRVSRTRWHFSLSSLIWLQLLLAPAFLSPFYYGIHQQHPYVGIAAWLLAPAAYVSLLLGPFCTQKCSVIRRVFCDALLGGLFCTLAIGPLMVPFIRRVMSGGVIGLEGWLWALSELAAVAAFVLFHYAILGGATGGLVGLVSDIWPRRRMSPTLNPEP